MLALAGTSAWLPCQISNGSECQARFQPLMTASKLRARCFSSSTWNFMGVIFITTPTRLRLAWMISAMVLSRSRARRH